MPSQQNIFLDGPFGRLEGVLYLPDATLRAVAVIAHPLPTMGGTMDNKVVTALAKAFTELGFAALRFNFRGVGNSEGSFDHGNGETLDVVAAASFMRAGYPGLPLVGAGFSFGGYVQARAAETVRPQHLVLVAPAVGRYAMPNVASNTLVIQGDLDEVVKLEAVLGWARPQHLPVVVLAGADHFFHGKLIELRQIVLRHFGVHS